MEHSLKLSQKMSQTLVLTQQMEQSIKILEMDTVELREYIQSVALENPTIDIDGLHEESPAELRKKKMEWLEQQAVKDKQYVGYYDPNSDYSLEKTVAAPQDESLAEYLTQQATFTCPKELLPAVVQVIGFIDDDGYLRAGTEEMLSGTSFDAAALQEAIRVIQGFDPPGVGAADLKECLLLQLDTSMTLERAIVRDYLDHLAKKKPEKAAKDLGVPVETVVQAFARIRRLNPKPGSAFSASGPPVYITPDVVVTNFQDRYYVLPCEFSYPNVRISGSMMEMLGSTKDEETVQYIKQKMKQAQWMQKCISSRGETLLAVARCIVQHQERFFRYGPQYLNILRMSDIASALEMHESTISRAVKNKYLQCAHGTFPLKHFFVQGLKSNAGAEDTSSHTLKCRIKDLIDQEQPGCPLSDQKLSELLVAEGVDISRRTVAKYRDQLGIPNSSYRR